MSCLAHAILELTKAEFIDIVLILFETFKFNVSIIEYTYGLKTERRKTRIEEKGPNTEPAFLSWSAPNQSPVVPMYCLLV